MVTTCCGIAPPIIGELSYHYFGLNPTLTQSFAYLLNVTGAAADFEFEQLMLQYLVDVRYRSIHFVW